MELFGKNLIFVMMDCAWFPIYKECHPSIRGT